MSNSHIQLALIGPRKWGRNYINTINKMAGVSLSRIVTTNKQHLPPIGPDCIVSDDYDSAIRKDTIDGVIISTPPHTHAKIANSILEAGKPILIEKPLTLSLIEAEALLEAAITNVD